MIRDWAGSQHRDCNSGICRTAVQECPACKQGTEDLPLDYYAFLTHCHGGEQQRCDRIWRSAAVTLDAWHCRGRTPQWLAWPPARGVPPPARSAAGWPPGCAARRCCPGQLRAGPASMPARQCCRHRGAAAAECAGPPANPHSPACLGWAKYQHLMGLYYRPRLHTGHACLLSS